MRIGSLVICERPSYYLTEDTHPVVNGIYTVRGLDEEGDLVFEEIINEVRMQEYGCFDEIHFSHDRFRELLPPISNIEEHTNLNILEPCVN